MKDLIEHQWRTESDKIVAGSFSNCHCVGVVSIPIMGSKVRLFYAAPNHELWRNDVFRLLSREELSVGFHPHHCDITLSQVFGSPYNIRMKVSKERGAIYLGTFIYESAIKSGGEAKFFHVNHETCHILRPEQLGTIHMKAEECHTIYVPEHKEAAWMVFEGKEDYQYRPHTYSNAPLEQMKFKHLYKPMRRIEVARVLSKLFDVSIQ